MQTLSPLSAPRPPVTEPVKTPARPWLRSASWDGFWMLSGFWIPTLFLLLPADGNRALLLTMTLCFWIGHRISSLYLALCVTEYASVIKARKGYFFGLPLLLLAGVTGYLLLPESVLPLSRLNRVISLGLIDYFFSLYHFSVQHYGVLSVYRSRLPHGQQDPGLLKWDWWLCLSVSGFFTVLMDFAHGELGMFGLLPTGAGEQIIGGLKLALSLAVAGFWLTGLRLYLTRQQGIARLLYLSTLCYMTVISFWVEPLLYFAIIQIQHWLVSLGLTTHMASRSRIPAKGWYRPWAWVNARAFGPLLVLMLLSLSLTPVLEADLYVLQNFDSETLSIPAFLSLFKDSLWIYLFAGLAFVSSFVHYLYDRGVYRFSDPLTRQAALSLLTPPEPK